MKKRNNVLKGAGVLLIVAFLVFSTTAVTANTKNKSLQGPQAAGGGPCNPQSFTKMNPSKIGRDILWDNGPWVANGGGNTKGTNTMWGAQWLEMCDDFEVGPESWRVTDGHFEGLCFNGNLDVDCVLVRFFDDLGDLPDNAHFFEEYSIDFTETDYFDSGWYHTEIDVNFGPVYLAPGTRYWVQFTPVGCNNDWHYQAYTNVNYGADCAHRDGDPSGTYAGGYSSFTWIHYMLGYDLCFRLTGTVNTAPNNPTCAYDRIRDELVVSATDPDGDQVRYGVSWDNDGNVDQWTGLYNSGAESRINCEGRTGTVGVIAEDEYGGQSDWTSVTAKNKPFNMNLLFLRFLGNHPHMFPILRHMLGL